MQICLLDPNAENKSWKLLKRFSFDQKYSFYTNWGSAENTNWN